MERRSTTHIRHAIFLSTASASSFLLMLAIICWEKARLDPSEYWAICCYCVVASWWIVYFLSPKLGINCLRSYLIQESLLRQARNTPDLNKSEQKEVKEALVTKASSTIQVQSIFIAIIALFLQPALENVPKQHAAFHDLLIEPLWTCATIAIVLMVFGIELLDTLVNSFRGTHLQSVENQLAYYKRISPFGQSATFGGGIGYAYLGFAAFSTFLIIALSSHNPKFAGLFLAAFVLFGYPFHFGYYRMPSGELRLDERPSYWGISAALLFLLVTIIFSTAC